MTLAYRSSLASSHPTTIRLVGALPDQMSRKKGPPAVTPLKK